MIDHDRLFKELISTFFLEFLDLFFPEMRAYIEPGSATFLDKEVFTDVTVGDRYATDLLVQVQFRGSPSFFLVHIENQASAQSDFAERMFRYFARLHEKYRRPVYPIVLFSYDRPRTPAPSQYTVEFPDFSVLSFNYRVIQLNRLNWRDYLIQPNPVASALMAKMQIALADRPKVKAECLRLLVTLKLNPAKMQLISGFVDTYLKLSQEETIAFNSELGRIEPLEQEQVMQIVTSWMEEGLAQGLEQGRRQECLSLVQRQLVRRVGPLADADRIEALSRLQLEALGEALLDFAGPRDLDAWLTEQSEQMAQAVQGLRGRLDDLPEETEARVRELSPQQLEHLGEMNVDLETLQTWLRESTGGETVFP